MRRAILVVLLSFGAGPALAQYEDLSSIPIPEGRPVLRRSAPTERAEPDAFDANDGFRRHLLAPENSGRWLIPTVLGDILLV
ncbi:MAG: hypothetical protein Q7J64_03435, partial [Elusimicrobiota bacterium]|nr:hypothetical protein [Elusimicrobiota bacterium]